MKRIKHLNIQMWVNILYFMRAAKPLEAFSLGRVVVPSSKLVINFSWTYKKLYCNRFSGTYRHTHWDPVNFTHGFILKMFKKDPVLYIKDEGDEKLFITLVPKVFDNVFLYVGLTTFGTYNEFCWVDLLGWVFKCFNQ